MSTPGGDLALPIAAVVCLAVGSYVVLVVIIIVIRYCLVSRGVCECSCTCAKPDEEQESCACCVNLAEGCNCCKSPSITSCLDSICPNRKRMGCVEILLCQCCGSAGAEGVCACCRCCTVGCPRCPCICDCDIDCSTITCCCITVHISASHDQVSSFKPNQELLDSAVFSTHQTSSFYSVPQFLRNNNLQSFTDLNTNVPSNASLQPSQQSSESQGFINHANSYQNPQICNQSAAFFLPDLPYNNGRQSIQGAQFVQQHALSSLSSPQELPCLDIATQTPRQFPFRRNTLQIVKKRKLKTAKDRYTPREIKSARLTRNVMFDPRLVQSTRPAWSNGKPILRNTGINNLGITRNLSIQALPRRHNIVEFQDKKIHSSSNVQH